jgi:uncharacterized protein (TIGR00369 family)
MTAERFNDLIGAAMPLATFLSIRAEAIGFGNAVLRLPGEASALRPGGAVSGPALMALADLAMYAAILGATGDERPVTTDLSIRFLKRPQPGRDVLASCRLLSLGRRLIVGAVDLQAEGGDLVAHCTCTYAAPPLHQADPRGIRLDGPLARGSSP